jgi:hypothetical protein
MSSARESNRATSQAIFNKTKRKRYEKKKNTCLSSGTETRQSDNLMAVHNAMQQIEARILASRKEGERLHGGDERAHTRSRERTVRGTDFFLFLLITS